MALHLGEDDLPSPGISSTADAGFPGNGLPGAAGENEEPGVREWALGGSGVAGARRLARGAGWANARLRVQESTWWVCGAFIQTLGVSVLASAKV